MNELDGAGDFRAVGETLPQPVFHRLDVVIGGAFDGFDALGDVVVDITFLAVESEAVVGVNED